MESRPQISSGQARVLAVFRQRAREAQPPPTYRDLCNEFGWSSTATARDHIKALVQKGLLRSAGGKARGACLLDSRGTRSFTLPIAGNVAAGHPAIAVEQVEGHLSVPEIVAPREDAFLLRVRGDSMQGAGILDGDLVAVVPEPDPPPGAVVAVTIGGETTLKRLERKGTRYRLVPENPAYAPIDVDTEDIVVHGVATGLLRKLRSGFGTPSHGQPTAVPRDLQGGHDEDRA